MPKIKKLPVAKASTPEVAKSYKPSKEDQGRERRWKAEEALRTCEQYTKIQGDKQLMNDVKTLAKEKMNDLKQVAK